mmetsp:Transcript_20622/g.30285  ORF Transcript_20622/g.30285 Transcript_20622/m.30285 type:complete len:346 (-) Transcript_20622:106-1143(-)
MSMSHHMLRLGQIGANRSTSISSRSIHLMAFSRNKSTSAGAAAASNNILNHYTSNLTSYPPHYISTAHMTGQGTTSKRFFAKKARLGNKLHNLEDRIKQKQHDDAVPRREKKKKGKKANRMQTKAQNDTHTTPEAESFDDMDDGYEEKEEDDDNGLNLPSSSKLRTEMQSVITHLETSLKSIRGNEPTPDMFDSISVLCYNTLTPLPSVAQVVITSPNLAKLSCYDPETAPAVRDAIRDAGMNLNPQIDDASSGDVMVPIPKVSAETRAALVKQVGKMAERSKNRIRNIRRKAHDICKKGQAGKLEGVSKDDAFRVLKEVDGVTDESQKELADVVLKKQESIMVI